ncbi:MAG TPA: L-2-amino-thiazoline-4-carboxylic acid hydrolase [Symbiobacteriaceae bacterium]|jgi:hypothetical protein
MSDTAKQEDMITYAEAVNLVRGAIEDRATWFHLLTQEADRLGYNAEEFARKAIRDFGCLKSNKMVPTESMEEFVEQFAHKLVYNAFEMEVVSCTEDRAELHFHYCALAEAWKKLGLSPDRIDTLCQWAVEGDYGVMNNFPALEFDPALRIAAGHDHCKMVFTRK